MKPTNQRNNKVIYASSYDRGLECLLDIWAEVRQQVPDATLDIFYGWNTFDAVHKNNPEQMRWKWQIIRKLHQLKELGVTEHGRITHQELAQRFLEAKVWAYPTEFTEIHCITALKAQQAGCIPVTTGCYALEETVVNNRYTTKTTNIYTNSRKRQEFVKKLVQALRSTNEIVKPVPNSDWTSVAKQWLEVIQQ